MTEIETLTKLVTDFRDKRDWKQFHNAKDSTISLSLEASELLELFQWKNGADLNKYIEENKEEISDELMDVLYWVLLIANDLNIDIGSAFEKKLDKNDKKYPVEKAKGVYLKYNQL